MNNIKVLDEQGRELSHFTQWDMNRKIRIVGGELPENIICQFSNSIRTETLNVVVKKGTTGDIEADVPNSLLQEPYHVILYLYGNVDGTESTLYAKRIPLKERAKPSEYEYIENIDRITLDLVKREFDQKLEEIKQEVEKEKVSALGLEVDYKTGECVRLGLAENLNAGVDFNSFDMFGGRKRCNVSDDGTIMAYYGDSSYKEDGSNGQVMIYQPAFWYKVEPLKLTSAEKSGYHLSRARYYVSENLLPGFKRHPAFYDADGKEINFILLSAYEGCAQSKGTGRYYLGDEKQTGWEDSMFASIAGAKPMSGKENDLTIGKAEKMAVNRGKGWHIDTIHSMSVNQLLMLVEYATPDMQRTLETGVVNINDTQNQNCSVITGSTSALGNASGYAEESLSLVSDELAVKGNSLLGFERQLGTGDPSPTNVRPIVTGGSCANLLDGTNVNRTTNGIAFATAPNGGIKITGTSGSTAYLTFNITRFKNQSVVFSANIPSGMRLSYQEYKNNAWVRNVYMDMNNVPVFLSLTTGDEIRLVFEVFAGTAMNSTIYPMLNYGNTAQPFVPYQAGVEYATRITMNGVTKLIPLREPLCAGDTFETNVLVNGVWRSRERHVRKKVVVTSISELFNPTSQRFANVAFDCFPTPTAQISNTICSCFPIKSHTDGLANGNGIVAGLVNATDARLRIYFPRDGSINSTADANAWLAANPITIIYDLATPVEYLGEPVTVASSNGNRSVSYRGMENPWGNIGKLMQGINVYSDKNSGEYQAYICLDNNFKENQKSANYAGTGFPLARTNGYAAAMGYSEKFDWLFLPSETTDISRYSDDFFNQNANLGGFATMVWGGDWKHKEKAGTFCLDIAHDNRFYDRAVGSRLLYIPQGL